MHPGEEIDALATDQERSDHCERLAAHYRNQWFVGRDQEIAYVFERARLRDWRFRRMSPGELEATGRSRWSRQVVARDLVEMEQMYSRWSHLYAARAAANPVPTGMVSFTEFFDPELVGPS